MNPRAIDTVQMIHESLPTVAATAPIENSTNGGTPLATQNAPVQSIPRWSPSALATRSPTAPFTAALMPDPYSRAKLEAKGFAIDHGPRYWKSPCLRNACSVRAPAARQID